MSQRSRGRPTYRDAIAQAYQEIDKDFTQPMRSHFEPIRRRAKVFLGVVSDRGLGDEAIRKHISDRWNREKASAEKQ